MAKNLTVWAVWYFAVIGLAAAQRVGWIAIPPWIFVLFCIVLLVFALVWWAVGREKPRFRQR